MPKRRACLISGCAQAVLHCINSNSKTRTTAVEQTCMIDGMIVKVFVVYDWFFCQIVGCVEKGDDFDC